MYEVYDALNENVSTVHANATVEEAIQLLIENNVSGMPVLDEEERLVGIITEFQLLERLFSTEVREMLVRDVMTQDVITVTPTEMLSDAAGLMLTRRIRCLPVVVNDKLVGIISRHDLLKYTLEAGDKLDEFLDQTKASVCAI